MTALSPSHRRLLDQVRGELSRLIRYDDESLASPAWVRQRYDSGAYPSLAPARRAVVATAWHEAGHAVAALAVGARFSSVRIHYSPGRPGTGQTGGRGGSAGRVNGITGAGDLAFVVDAAGQVAERLRDWTLPGSDAEVARFLDGWRADGGDARRFRRGLAARFGPDEAAAWRYSAALLTPCRPAIRQVARAVLVTPRPLPYPVVAALATNDHVHRPRY
jgi:hypothetical protein